MEALELCSCGDNRNVLKDHLVDLWQKDGGGEFNPSFLGVGDDDHLRVAQEVLQKLHQLGLDLVEALPMSLGQSFHFLLVSWIEVGGREQGVVVVQNHNILVCAWLLDRGQPNLVG